MNDNLTIVQPQIRKPQTEQYGQIDDIGIYLFSDNDPSELPDLNNMGPIHPHDDTTSQAVNKKDKRNKMRRMRLRVKRCTGRWKCKEHLLYMQITRIFHQDQRELFSVLEEQLPWRSMVQIRAHHQKMMSKFGDAPNMLRAYPNSDENLCLMDISRELEDSEKILSAIGSSISGLLNK